MGVLLGGPACPTWCLSPAVVALTGGTSPALSAPKVVHVQVDLHSGGEVPLKEPSKGVQAGPYRGRLALDLPLGLLVSRGGGFRGSPLGFLVADMLHHHPRFYIFSHPEDCYNNKKRFGHTWSEWAKK